MQVNSISFKSLPFNLGMKPAVQANSQEMVEILKDAAGKAYMPFSTTPKDVRESNPDLFDEYGRVQPEALKEMVSIYDIKETNLKKLNCGQLRDAFAAYFTKFGDTTECVYPPLPLPEEKQGE